MFFLFLFVLCEVEVDLKLPRTSLEPIYTTSVMLVKFTI